MKHYVLFGLRQIATLVREPDKRFGSNLLCGVSSMVWRCSSCHGPLVDDFRLPYRADTWWLCRRCTVTYWTDFLRDWNGEQENMVAEFERRVAQCLEHITKFAVFQFLKSDWRRRGFCLRNDAGEGGDACK